MERAKAGNEILLLLDNYGFDAHAAGWLHDETTGIWRYILVTPMLRTQGPTWIYSRLLKLFRKHPLPEGISPLDLVVIDEDIERAVFGAVLVHFDARDVPGIQMIADAEIDGLFVGKGFVAFYRRMQFAQRATRTNASRGFDNKIQRLAA